MQSSTTPIKFTIPFAAFAGAGYIHGVPLPSQIGITTGAASFTDGFVPANFLPLGAGGVPPDGKDVNGILNITTSWVQRFQAGYFPVYDATHQAGIGGYPLGTILQRANGAGFWRSTTENNITDPDTGGAGWVLHGVATVFDRTGDIVATTGDYTVAQITGAVADTDFQSSLGINGYEVSPSGKIEMWGMHTSASDSEFVTFPTIAGAGAAGFPTACLNVTATVVNNSGASVDNIQTSSWGATGFTLYARAQERTVSWRATGH